MINKTKEEMRKIPIGKLVVTSFALESDSEEAIEEAIEESDEEYSILFIVHIYFHLHL